MKPFNVEDALNGAPDELVEMERLFQEYCKTQNLVNRGKPKFVLEDDIDE